MIEKVNNNKIKDKSNNNSNKKVENQIIYRIMIDDNLSTYCIEVIEEFIQHFLNFNLPKKVSMEIIKEIYNKYGFDKIYFDYFIDEINSNTFIKKESYINITEDMSENNDNYIIPKEDNSNDKKLNLLVYSIYNIDLDIKDYLNVLKLNKEYYKFLRKVVYKKILLNNPNIEFNKKIKIWKIILDYNENKKLYNYQELKTKIMQNSINPKDSDIINVDVMRTNVIQNKELNQKKISNILKAVVEAIPGISYNQGMNYVAAFLFNILYLKKSEKEKDENEEETFYLFLGLFTSTKYGELFKNNLELLKKFYFILERLISIFIPELYSFFQNNNIKISYFITSWFVTLFTNISQINNLNYEFKILVKILDFFFFYGWKSIFVTIIVLIKNYEDKIMSLKSGELLTFLNSDINKGTFFENENFDIFINEFNNFKIDEELIKRIEKEFDMKINNPKLSKNLRFQII